MSGDSCDDDDDLSSEDDGFIVPDDETIEVFDNYPKMMSKKRKLHPKQTICDEYVMTSSSMDREPDDWFQFMAKHMKR